MIIKNTIRNEYRILNSLQELVWVCKEDFSCVFFNRMARTYFGDEKIASENGKFFHPVDFDSLKEPWRVNIKNRESFTARIRLRKYDGEYQWHYVRMNPIENEENDSWLILALNIEARVAAEEELKKNRNTLEVVLENSPEIIIINNYRTHQNVYSNNGLSKVLGITSDYMNEIGDQFLEKHIHPEDLNKVIYWLESAGQKKPDNQNQLLHRIMDINGKWHWVTMKSVVFSRTEAGEINEILSYLSDVTFLKETEERLQNSLNFIKQIAQTSPDLIVIFDVVQSKVVYSNQLYSFPGYSVDVLKSRNEAIIKQIIYPDDWLAYLNFCRECELGAGNGLIEIEYRVVNLKGDVCWIRERGRVFKTDDKGTVTQIISIIQDITERKKVEESHRENELLNKLLEKKDEFMSVASHELKTPITTMKAAIQIMKRLIEKHTDEKTLLVFIAKANQQVNKLTSLISDLLDNAKIQAGKMLLNITLFSLSELIDDCVSHMTNHHVITVRNSVNKEIEGDRIRIEQVLINFIGNAIKYSPEGKEIIIDAKEENEMVKISVTDFGIGIPEEKTQHLFDRFYRVDNKSQEFSGLGLGLYISAEIIKQHGGDYGVISEEGKGSTFWFTIPVKQQQNLQDQSNKSN